MTAKEKLKEITNRNIWYLGAFEENYAYQIKNRLKNNKLSLDKVYEILDKLGIKPKQEEIW